MSTPVIVTLCASLVQSTAAAGFSAGFGARIGAGTDADLTAFGAGLAASVDTNAVPGRNPAIAVVAAAISMAAWCIGSVIESSVTLGA
jgi:hypothetical protein